jgi:hypothetical protein
MDIFDALVLGLPDPVNPDPKRPRAHNVVALVGTFAFPLALFFLILLTDVHRNPTLWVFTMPAVLAAVSFGLCRGVGADWSWTLRVTFVCALSSFMFAAIAFLLAVFMSFYSMF